MWLHRLLERFTRRDASEQIAAEEEGRAMCHRLHELLDETGAQPVNAPPRDLEAEHQRAPSEEEGIPDEERMQIL